MAKNCLGMYRELKKTHPDFLLLLRSGDFYQMFNEDAREGARILGITLAYFRNDHKTATCVFPHHELDTYLPRLIRAGKRVAICNQLEPPKPTKKRGITELVNPKNNEEMKLNINNQNETKNVQSAQEINNAAAIAEPIEDAVIVEEQPTAKSQQPKAKGGSKKSDGRGKKPATKAAANSKPSTLNSQLSLVTYTTKKGGTACYITGFKTEADAKAMADQLPHSISNSYRYSDKGEKVYVLSFGTRYVDAASSMCEALNAGKKTDLHAAIAKCHEIYNAVVSSAKAEREKKTQERKAERAKAKADELAKVKKANGLYSMDDIAAMMKRALAGEDVPELAAVKEVLKAA